MSDYDGLRGCVNCGNDTTGRLCRSCAEQEMIDNGADAPDDYIPEPPPDDRTREEALFDEMAAMAEYIIELARHGRQAVEAIRESPALAEELGDDLLAWEKAFDEALNDYDPDMDDGHDDPRYGGY